MAKNKHTLRKIMVSRLWLSVFAIIVAILLFNSLSLFLKRVKVWQKVAHLEQEKHTLLERKKVIEVKKQSLETDFGREAVFRERFNVARPGEEVIIVTEAKPAIVTQESSIGFIRFFRNLFK